MTERVVSVAATQMACTPDAERNIAAAVDLVNFESFDGVTLYAVAVLKMS